MSQRNVFFFLGKIQGVADSKLKRTQPKYTTRIKVWLCESWISKKCYHFWDRLYLEEVTNWGWLVLLIGVGHVILCRDFMHFPFRDTVAYFKTDYKPSYHKSIERNVCISLRQKGQHHIIVSTNNLRKSNERNDVISAKRTRHLSLW